MYSKTGLPQGSVLGPILFCLYINDLPTICTDTECQMYADDTVFYVSAKNPHQASEILSRQMVGVSEWLQRNHLTLNYKKTVSMCFSIREKVLDKFHITIDAKEIDVVNDFKYLGVTLDSRLKFDIHIKKLSKTVKTSLNCFRLIRSCLSFKAAHLYLHAMVLSHLSYCITSWSQATDSTIKPLFSLYKQALNILDQKPQKWHHS